MAGNEEFLATLPEDIRGDTALRDIADIGSLAKGYVNAQKLVGSPISGERFVGMLPENIRTDAYFAEIKDVPTLAQRAFEQARLLNGNADRMITLPAPDDAEGWNSVWGKLGRPAAPDQYQLKEPADLPAEMVPPPERKADFQKLAHDLGFSQKQAETMYQRLLGDRAQVIGALKTGIVERDATLATKWGTEAAIKNGDVNLLIDDLSTKFNLGTALREAVDNTPGPNGVAIKDAFAEVGKLMREHKLIGSGSGGTPGATLSPPEAQQQINAMYADPAISKTLRDQHAPGHADAVAKMQKLFELAYPEPAAA